MPKHTPTPWRVEGDSIYGPDGGLVIAGELDGYMTPFGCRSADEGEANAAFVVRAINCHEALLEALRRLVELEDAFLLGEARLKGCTPTGHFPSAYAAARAAIAKATGVQS